MRKIQRFTLRHRAAFLVVVLVALATVVLAAGRNLNRMVTPNGTASAVTPPASTTPSPAALALAAPLPAPASCP